MGTTYMLSPLDVKISITHLKFEQIIYFLIASLVSVLMSVDDE